MRAFHAYRKVQLVRLAVLRRSGRVYEVNCIQNVHHGFRTIFALMLETEAMHVV
jgi:hypothetical protein